MDDDGAPIYDVGFVDRYPVPAPFTTSVNDGLERVVYADAVGTLTPNNGLFTSEDTGWIDVRPFGIAATRRSHGEYVVLVEDDERIKTVVYRWRR